LNPVKEHTGSGVVVDGFLSLLVLLEMRIRMFMFGVLSVFDLE